MSETSLYTGNGAPIERPVPYDLEAEDAVLGSLLLDRDAIIHTATWLAPSDFYREANGWIYDCMLDLYGRREPPDLVILSSELDRRGVLDKIGGLAHLASLMRRVPTAVHVEYYGRIVERTSVLRRLITVGGQIAGLGYEKGQAISTVLDRAETLLFGVTQRQGSKEFVAIKELLEGIFDELSAQTGVLVDGVPMGFDRLDRLTSGLHGGEVVIVAARPGMGKSSFALSAAYNAALLGIPVGVFSLEMSGKELAKRLIAIDSGVPAQAVRLGRIADSEWQRVSDTFGKLADAPLYFDDSAALSLTDVRSRARRLKSLTGCKLLVIDYLQLMAPTNARAGTGNRAQELSELTRGLKVLAKELDVAIMALSQISRKVEERADKVPLLSDLRESGAIEENADIVMFIYREEVYEPETHRKGLAEIHIAKHRNGALGVVPLNFHAPTTFFSDIPEANQPI